MSTNTSTTIDPTISPGDGTNKDILLIVASVAMAVATVFLIIVVKLLERCLPRNSPPVENELQKEERVKEILGSHTLQMTYTDWIMAERLKHHNGINFENEEKAPDQLYDSANPARLASAPKEVEVWATDCAVCLAEFVGEELVNELPCEHIFHNKCIHDWFMKAKQAACPLCRNQIRLAEEAAQVVPPAQTEVQVV